MVMLTETFLQIVPSRYFGILGRPFGKCDCGRWKYCNHAESCPNAPAPAPAFMINRWCTAGAGAGGAWCIIRQDPAYIILPTSAITLSTRSIQSLYCAAPFGFLEPFL